MSEIKRKILFYIFVLAFIIMTPAITLYASGYKIDWRHPFTILMIKKTGMLMIESDPARANIFLNGKKQKKIGWSLNQENLYLKTPLKMKDVLPGLYDLKIELSDYWPWERRIAVYSGQITHVLDVRLFKKNLPLLLAEGPLGIGLESPNRKKIFLPENNLLIDLKNETAAVIASTTPENKNASWSEDSSRLIAGTKIINLKTAEKNLNLSDIIGKGISQIQWDDNNSNRIYYLYKNSLNRFNLENRTNEILLTEEKILDYFSKGNELFYISQDALAAKLKIYSLSEKKLKKEISLPSSDGYKFINRQNKLLNILDEKYKILYLANPNSSYNPFDEIINNTKYAAWFNDKIIFAANDFEIFYLNKEDGSKKIITRISEPIKGIVKTKTDNYLFYYTAQSIYLLTWDKGDETMQKIELAKLDQLSGLILSEDEKTLYFSGKIGNAEGLYKLNLK